MVDADDMFFSAEDNDFRTCLKIDTTYPVSSTPGEQQAQHCAVEVRLVRDGFGSPQAKLIPVDGKAHEAPWFFSADKV